MNLTDEELIVLYNNCKMINLSEDMRLLIQNVRTYLIENNLL